MSPYRIPAQREAEPRRPWTGVAWSVGMPVAIGLLTFGCFRVLAPLVFALGASVGIVVAELADRRTAKGRAS